MSKVVKADASVGEARFYTSHSPPSHYFVQFDVACAAAAFAARDAAGTTNGNRIFEILVSQDGFRLRTPWDPDAGYWTLNTPNGPFTGFTPDTWHTISFEYNAGAVTWQLDGSTFDSYTGVITGSPLIFQFGAFGATHIADQVYYLRNVKIGTTAGGTDIFADDFASGDLSAWETVIGDATVVDDPGFTGGGGGGGDGFTGEGGGGDGGTPFGDLVIKIYDLASTELADITPIAFEPSLEVDMDNCGPWHFTLTCPAAHELLTAAADDGFPNLRKLNRKLIVWEGGKVIFHGRIFDCDRVGDGTENLVKITAYNPWFELGFDGDDRAGRIVRGSTNAPTAGTPYGEYDGNFISPKFASSVGGQAEISGPDLILQILTNSQNVGAESDPTPGEGPLPISLTGIFDLDVPPAVDLSVVDTMDWPAPVGDFITQLIDTGVCDVYMRPVDPAEGLGDYIMVELNAVSSWGTDMSDTVHFDYFTGSKNAGEAEHVESGESLCNKPYMYLGPRLDQNHWKANITPGSPGVTVDPTDSRALYGGPGADPGEFMQIQVYDGIGDESSSRPLYLAIFNAELGYRAEPRDLLYITPVKGAAALFDALHDFSPGDTVAVNVGAALGVSLAETQRVFGFTKSWDRQFVPAVSRLMTSADINLGG